MVFLYYWVELFGLTALSFPKAYHGTLFSCLWSPRGIDEKRIFPFFKAGINLHPPVCTTGLCCIFYASLYWKSVENSRSAEHRAEIQIVLERGWGGRFILVSSTVSNAKFNNDFRKGGADSPPPFSKHDTIGISILCHFWLLLFNTISKLASFIYV